MLFYDIGFNFQIIFGKNFQVDHVFYNLNEVCFRIYSSLSFIVDVQEGFASFPAILEAWNFD
tara:strand:+ start:238 stop:423 length:186 start_codon:yes stop_codon:yes gene_type:complete